MIQHSDYIVYVDESGDHSLDSINAEYPIFVLACCVFRKEEYCSAVIPSFHRFKFRYFGHDAEILHEAEIRKSSGPFSILLNPMVREPFFVEIDRLVKEAPFYVIASAILKIPFKRRDRMAEHVYHLAVEFCLERLAKLLEQEGQGNRLTHVIFESRGREEDRELELQFRRICDGQNSATRRLPFEIVIADKRANAPGLQMADLIARPIGRHILNPSQSNRAWAGIEPKFYCPTGATSHLGGGLKIFP